MAEQLTPPGINFDEQHSPRAPYDGRFLVELGGKAVPPEVVVPISENGRPMSPVEAATGVPLPIVGPRGRTPNRHHAFFYESAYNNGTLGQQAVRLARIQRTGRYIHQRAHRSFDGTAFPVSESQEWEIAILSLAGYVPSFGVKFKNNEPHVEELSVKEKKLLRRTDTIIQEKPSQEHGKIGEFLLKYAYGNNLGRSKQLWVEEFLEIPDDTYDDDLLARKLELAEKLTNRAIDTAVDPVRPIFSEARQSRRLRNGSPNSVWKIVKDIVGKRIPGHVDLLEGELARQFGVSVSAAA